MLSDERFARELLGALDRTDFGHLGVRHEGKVRDSYVDGDVRTIVTTDRLSAFDRLLGTIPFKGQVLNEIANYWFDATSDIGANHLLEVPDPNVVRVRECAPVPLEFVVRAYITGVTKTSLWVNYQAGARNIAGNLLPSGLRKNERLAAPVLTPTTKLEAHDRNLGRDDAIAEGLVTADLFDRCADVCFRLFAQGTELAAQRGLILVDTKYELACSAARSCLSTKCTRLTARATGTQTPTTSSSQRTRTSGHSTRSRCASGWQSKGSAATDRPPS
jgi:phosphoribosylaminoimidazole-succinocarboxamide synthase